MKKIVLIEPQSKEDHVYKHVRMPRLGLPILGTQLQEAGYQVALYVGTGNTLPWPQIVDADLVGISTTTATCREAYQIAGLLRSSGVKVVIGGIHATFLPDEALQFADYVVRGEAENNFLPLVKTLEKGGNLHDIPGVSFWHKNKPVHNAGQESRVDMDSFPIPDLSLVDHYEKMRSVPVMTSRGCPFNCTFCSVTQMFGRRYRYRCTESVLEELDRYPGKHIFFCDDNFAADAKRSKELMRGIIDRDIKIKGWGAQVRVEAAFDDEMIELMHRSGCSIVYIGFESINPDTLKGYNKQQTVEDIEEAIKRFHKYGIRIHGMFVFGGDGDTVETIHETVDFALKAHIDTVQLLMLTPLPGTTFFEKLENEGRILTHDWSLYDGHHAVFKPALMSPAQMQVETVEATKRFYALKNIFSNVPHTGWASALYRTIGWGLSRHFESKNRWYPLLLNHLELAGSKPVTYFDRLLKAPEMKKSEYNAASSALRVSLIEQKGIFYLKMRGFVNNLQLRELNRVLQSLLPGHCSQMVVNTDGLRFASEQAAKRFGVYLEKLGTRVRRLQVVTTMEKHAKSLLHRDARQNPKLPRFELLLHKH